MYVVLAAGDASRMGFAKVFTPLAGTSPLTRVARAIGDRTAICVVQGPRLNDAIEHAPELLVVVNDSPDRGMMHSLRLALEAIPPDRTIGVILADMPLLEASLLDALESAATDSNADVVFPRRADGTPGYPMLFSLRARAALTKLGDGDRLGEIRDDASLSQCAVAFEDPAAFCDLDLPEDWNAFGA
ncbi:MAG: NTP transferase domain-containing protein [bacterium]|nr:NTP transferase domain-containing protein [bacterium]